MSGGHSVTREALRSRERYLDIGKAPARPGSVSGINNAFVKEKNIADATIFLRRSHHQQPLQDHCNDPDGEEKDGCYQTCVSNYRTGRRRGPRDAAQHNALQSIQPLKPVNITTTLRRSPRDSEDITSTNQIRQSPWSTSN
ncbi:hypothetical protein J6590_074132 [Homalodisca vitripennis]|nr:hypothetical protein J6590_074132 [Homalodisca vitripennis]